MIRLDLGLVRLSLAGYIVIKEPLLAVSGSHGALGHHTVVEVVGIQNRQLNLLLLHLVDHELTDAFLHLIGVRLLSLFGARVKEDLLLLHLTCLFIQHLLLRLHEVLVLLLLVLFVHLCNLLE